MNPTREEEEKGRREGEKPLGGSYLGTGGKVRLNGVYVRHP